MKTRIASLTLGALVLAGCESSRPDFSATAPDTPATASLSGREAIHAHIAEHAAKYNIPESLIHRSVQRESRYNPAARNGPYWGLMQIRYDTARSMGYTGSPNGLLDAKTNLDYAVPYLANAWMLSGGDEARAIQLYAKGYYYEAKRMGMLKDLRTAAE